MLELSIIFQIILQGAQLNADRLRRGICLDFSFTTTVEHCQFVPDFPDMLKIFPNHFELTFVKAMGSHIKVVKVVNFETLTRFFVTPEMD